MMDVYFPVGTAQIFFAAKIAADARARDAVLAGAAALACDESRAAGAAVAAAAAQEVKFAVHLVFFCVFLLFFLTQECPSLELLRRSCSSPLPCRGPCVLSRV